MPSANNDIKTSTVASNDKINYASGPKRIDAQKLLKNTTKETKDNRTAEILSTKCEKDKIKVNCKVNTNIKAASNELLRGKESIIKHKIRKLRLKVKKLEMCLEEAQCVEKQVNSQTKQNKGENDNTRCPADLLIDDLGKKIIIKKKEKKIKKKLIKKI